MVYTFSSISRVPCDCNFEPVYATIIIKKDWLMEMAE